MLDAVSGLSNVRLRLMPEDRVRPIHYTVSLCQGLIILEIPQWITCEDSWNRTSSVIGATPFFFLTCWFHFNCSLLLTFNGPLFYIKLSAMQ